MSLAADDALADGCFVWDKGADLNEPEQRGAGKKATGAALALGLAGLGALALAGAGEPPVRIVPHLAADPVFVGNELLRVGGKDPTGRFAAWLAVGLHGYPRLLYVQDLRQNHLAWIVPAWGAEAVAFSRDGSELAVCGSEGGLFLDLAQDRVLPAPWLRGGAIAFAPDDRHIWLADGESDPYLLLPEERRPYRLYCFTSRGVRTRTFPLEMNIPGRIALSKDGASVVVEGVMGYGLGGRDGGAMQPITQTINLESARAETQKGKPEPGWGSWKRTALLRYPDRLPALPKDRAIAQTFSALHWHEPTRRFVVMGSGVVKAWDAIEGARLLRTVGKGNSVTPVGFGPDGALLASAWHDHAGLPPEVREKVRPDRRSRTVELLTRLDLETGKATPLPIPAQRHSTELTPDGQFAAMLVREDRDGPNDRLQIWELRTGRRLTEIAVGDGRVIRYRWVAQGIRLAAQVAREGRCVLRLWNRMGELVHELPCPDSDFDVDPDGRFAVVAKWRDDREQRGVRIVELAAGKERNRIEGLRRWDTPARFLGTDTIVVGDESIALWHIGGAKPIWERGSRGWLESVAPRLDAAVITVHYSRGADILSAETGRHLPGGLATERACCWHHPTPIARGAFALDPLHGSYIVRLVETDSGQTIATFAPFADPDWMVWTPDGFWTGSDDALRWVSFYRGTELLGRDEIATLRQPELVRRRIAQALTHRQEPAQSPLPPTKGGR